MSKIADTLREAADEHLCDGSGDHRTAAGYPGQTFSCGAVWQCLDKWDSDLPAIVHLHDLGVGVSGQFDEFEEGPERQSVRYAWLMFAADMAEEFGLD